MNDPLVGPRIKLDRAHHHLIELKRTEREFFEKNPCRIVFDTQTQPGHKLAKIVLDAKPPEIIHVLAGEMIYQMRSALDQIVVALARISAAGINPKKVKFPCGESVRDFKGQCRSYQINKFDRDLLKQIIRLRPYDGANDTLRAACRMGNIDKHMELIAVGASGGITGISDFEITDAFTGLIISGQGGDLNAGVVFSDLWPGGTIAPKHPNAQIYVSGQITLGDIEPYQRRPLVFFLGSIFEEVRRAHESVQDLLVSSGRVPPKIMFWRGALV